MLRMGPGVIAVGRKAVAGNEADVADAGFTSDAAFLNSLCRINSSRRGLSVFVIDFVSE
jgi:hypothetical protein